MCLDCGLDGVRREGSSLMGHRNGFQLGPFLLFISFEPRYCLTHIPSSNIVHLEAKALRIQDFAPIFPLT